MKEKEVFNTTNIRARRDAGCCINLNPKSGRILISKEAAEIIGIGKNKISISRFSARPKEWFIEIDNNDGIQFTYNGKNQTWYFQSVIVARAIAESLELNGPVSIPIARQKEDGAYAILTKGAKVYYNKKQTQPA